MSEPKQYTHADPNMIVRRAFDEKLDANRVIIVAGEMPEFKFPQAGQQSNSVQIERIEVPVIVKEVQFKEIEKIIVQEKVIIERIEVPTIITKTETQYVDRIVIEKQIQEIVKEVPVYITNIEYVDKPMIIKDTEYKDLPKWITICLAAQILISIVTMLLKK